MKHKGAESIKQADRRVDTAVLRNTSRYKVFKYVSIKYQTISYEQQKTPKMKLLRGARKKEKKVGKD